MKQLEILVNGKQAPVISSTSYGGLLRVLLLIDTSASMRPVQGGNSDWGIGLPTAAFAMDAIAHNAEVAVGTFAKHLQVSQWQSWSAAREQVLSFERQIPKGSTALYSPVNEAASTFGNKEFGNTIYLATDGGENQSPEKLSHVISTLIARGIAFFVFLVVPPEYKTMNVISGTEDMEALGTQTGGLFLTLPLSRERVSSREASIMAKQIQDAVASPYQIDFHLAEPINKSAKLKLETPLDPKLFTLAYPRHLEPCIAVAPPN